MRKFLFQLIVLLVPVFGIGQNYNPFVAQGIISPAPLPSFENAGTGQVSFVVGNSGSDALPLVAGQEMRVTVSLSFGVPDNVDPIAAIGGSFAVYFNWVYNSVINTYQGTQNQLIPGGLAGAGTVTMAYRVTANSTMASPQNGFNANITPPAYTNGINSPSDDQVSSYTWTVASTDLSISKTDGATSYTPGTTTTYTIIASNNGPSAVTGATISDAIPSGVTWSYTAIQSGGASGYSASGITSINDLVNMPSGSSITYTVIVSIPANFTGNLENTATVTAPGNVTDNNLGNNAATDTDTQSSSADISLVKSVDNAGPNVGGTVVFSIVVTNNGPSAATGVSVSDVLPSGYTFVSDNAAGAYVAGVWTVGDLANGASATLLITATVNAAGNYTNTATVSSSTADPNPGNNTDNASTTPSAQADVDITKTVDNQFQSVDGTVVFTIAVHNGGPSNASNVVVNDLLPSGFDFVSASPSQGTYNENTGVWTVGNVVNTASATLTITAMVNATGSFVNTATVTADQADPNAANNTSTTTNFVIQANNDNGAANGVTGGTAVANVLANDLLNAVTPTTGDVTISVITAATDAGVVLNTATGAVTVAAGTPAGTYTIVYQVCDLAHGSNCDQATVTISVGTGISGTVHDDANGSTDALINDGAGTNAGGTLYVSLVSGGTVIATTAVNADGTYNFNNINAGAYTLVLHTSVAGSNSAALPAGWVHTGEGTTDNGDGNMDGVISITLGSAVSSADFGIEQLPVAVNTTASTAVNPGGTNNVEIGAANFGGTDADGIISNLTITSFPTNTSSVTVHLTTYYPTAGDIPVGCSTCAVFPIAGIDVPTDASGQPTQIIAIDPIDGFVNAVISYTVTDNAGYASANAGAVTVPFVELPDITPNITVAPNSMEGITNFDVTVKVTEINGVATNGLITVLVPKDLRVAFTYDPGLTTIGDVIITPLDNANWNYDGSNAFYHVFTSTSIIPANGFSTFGFKASFNPFNTRGVYTLTSTINSGSGGENRTFNNNDAEIINYSN